MRRLLCALLAALLLAAPAALAEEKSLSLRLFNWEIGAGEGCEATVHLLLYKSGSACYELQDVEIRLYDEAGEEVPVLETEKVVFPLKSVPAGEHYVPVTLRCTLAEAAAIASVDVLSVTGVRGDEAGMEELDWNLPYLGTWEDGHLAITAWMPLEDGTDAADYCAMLLALDGENNFIGTGELPQGAGCAVEAADIFGEIEAATGHTAQWLAENGFVFDRERYVFFERVPMTYLQELPDSFVIYCYRAQSAEPAGPVELLMERIDMREDGSFVIHGCMQNVSGSLQRLNAIDGMSLYDAAGNEVVCDDFTYDAPFRVMGAGELLPYTIEGRVEAGFAAERFLMSMKVDQADAADHHALKGVALAPSFGEKMTVSATLPAQEGLDPADCFFCVMLLDLENDVYYGAVWSYVNEAWLQDGEIRFPTMDGPAGVPQTIAMVTTCYAAE